MRGDNEARERIYFILLGKRISRGSAGRKRGLGGRFREKTGDETWN